MRDMSSHEVNQQLARGLARALEQHVTIAARGFVTATGDQFFIVNSASHNGTQYLVAAVGSRLVCSCPAGEHDLICKHVALVRALLVAERMVV